MKLKLKLHFRNFLGKYLAEIAEMSLKVSKCFVFRLQVYETWFGRVIAPSWEYVRCIFSLLLYYYIKNYGGSVVLFWTCDWKYINRYFIVLCSWEQVNFSLLSRYINSECISQFCAGNASLNSLILWLYQL